MNKYIWLIFSFVSFYGKEQLGQLSKNITFVLDEWKNYMG